MKILLFLIYKSFFINCLHNPLIFNTWNFDGATQSAWQELMNSQSAINAVESGCSFCERTQCDYTVGYGGSPDESNGISLDAMIIDGDTLNIGAVAGLKYVRNAISVAKHVLQFTKHSLLVGEDATKFALSLNFKTEPMHSEFSNKIYEQWKQKNCQPNFWMNVKPDPQKSCGPYKEICTLNAIPDQDQETDGCFSHDTIGMLAIDSNGKLAAGTSSNNAKFRIPGRAGDAAIIGAGAYAKSSIGGAVATGDGDIMMRFVPSFKAVHLLELGFEAQIAAETIIKDIWQLYPKFEGAILIVSTKNLTNITYGAACSGFPEFPFCIQNSNITIIEKIPCLH